VHDNLATIVGAGIDTFWFAELPAPLQLMLAIRLVGLAEEFTPDQQHPTATRIKDPRGETLSEMAGTFAIGAQSARPEFLAGITLPAALQFEVAEEGSYAIECEFGGASKSLPLHVVQGLPPGAEPPAAE
jgi:hypothetical protein